MPREPRRILLPVDFSQKSLDWAYAASAEYQGDEVSFIHVLSPLPVMSPAAIWNSVTDEMRIRLARLELSTELTRRGLDDPHVIVVIGEPGPGIADVAISAGADLIAMSTRGRQGLDRWLRGSVAEDVVRTARCPVVVSKLDANTPASPPSHGMAT